MGKIIIQCPDCGKFVEWSSGLFGTRFMSKSSRMVRCSCGKEFDIRENRFISRECPHCGNEVVFDQTKGEKALCPVCHNPINTMAEQSKTVEFSCGRCGVRLRTTRGVSATYTCPVCDFVNNVEERLMREHLKAQDLPSEIKYEGDNSTFIWKHPIEDFRYGSQLIVHESQEAIFFLDGQALDLFEAGRHTLETQKLPILDKAYRLPVHNGEVFHSEVYFINKTVQMDHILWGTPDKVRFLDPLTGAPLELGVSGELSLMVSDSRKMLVKLVGTMNGIAWSDEGPGFTKSLQKAFRPMIASAVKTELPAVIKANNLDVLDLDMHLDLISAKLREKILPNFAEYGLTAPELYITGIMYPEDDPNFQQIRRLHTATLKSQTIQAETALRNQSVQAETSVRTTEELGKAAVEAAHREAVLQSESTKTTVARLEAERKLMAARAEAEAKRLEGYTEAQVMAAKGYTQKDVFQTDVQKAYAEGIGNMGSGSGGGSGDGVMGNILGLGVGLATAGAVMPQISNMVQGMNGQTAGNAGAGPDTNVPKADDGWTCPNCGTMFIHSKFCPECGTKQPGKIEAWECPNCGAKGITSKFCPECGTPRPADSGWTCPECGTKNIKSKFCPNCGAKKGE